MSQWTADFTNDSNNDYELIVQIFYEGEEVGLIKNGKQGLELIWFAHGSDYNIPFDWFFGLMNEAKTLSR